LTDTERPKVIRAELPTRETYYFRTASIPARMIAVAMFSA
jgi:hypothetical protein